MIQNSWNVGDWQWSCIHKYRVCPIYQTEWHSACNYITNELAEHAVQTFKDGMKKLSEGSLETNLLRFLFNYRSTNDWSVTCRMYVCETTEFTVRSNASWHSVQCYSSPRAVEAWSRPVSKGEKHQTRRFCLCLKLCTRRLPGVVVEARGCSYTVCLEDRRVVRRQVEHIRVWELQDETHPIPTSLLLIGLTRFQPHRQLITEPAPDPADGVDNNQGGGTMDDSSQPLLRHSNRTCRPPECFSKWTEQYVCST